MNGAPSNDLDEQAVTIAADELLDAAGRPELFVASLTPYEQEAWRVITRRVIRAYLEAAS